jgi:type IV secretion system protein VirD4
MQLPADDELVLMSGCHPIRAKKVRYYENRELKARILPPPELSRRGVMATAADSSTPSGAPDWAGAAVAPPAFATDDPANAGIRREPELPEHEEIAPGPAKAVREFEPPEEESDDDTQRLRAFPRNTRSVPRPVSLDPADDRGL